MLNFDTDLDRAGVARQVRQSYGVTETVVARRPSEHHTFDASDAEKWDWRQVRDYVIVEIEKRFGPVDCPSGKQFGVFSAFAGRWGALAGPIAKYAFEISDGIWNGTPITVNRFAKGSDPYFAAVIADRLPSRPVQVW